MSAAEATEPADAIRQQAISPDTLADLRASGALPVEAYREAAWWIAQPPPPATWRRILDPLALALGVALIVAGVLYVVAFNWSELGRISKVVVGLLPVLVAGGTAALLGTDRLPGKVVAAAGLPLTLGLLLAIGLAYPTDAEPWPLFALWAALCVPWAIASRLGASWIGVAIAVDVALLSWFGTFDPGPLGFDAMMATWIGAHALGWAAFGVARLAGVPGAFDWVRHTLLAPVLAGLAFWPMEALTVGSLPEGTWTVIDPIGIVLYVVVGLVIQVGFGLGRIGPFPAAVHLLTLLVIVTTSLIRLFIEFLDDFELAALLFTLPLGLAVLLQLAISSGWLMWGWRRQQARARAAVSEDAETGAPWRIFGGRPEGAAERPTWWPRLDAVLAHLRGEGLLEDPEVEDVEAAIVEAVEARQDPAPWYLKGALFTGGLLAGGVLACTCGPLATLSTGAAFLLPAALLGLAAVGARWGRPSGWGEWLDPLLFAAMVAATLLLILGLGLTLDLIGNLDAYTLSLVAGALALVELALLVIFPDRWHRTLGTVVLCGCFAAISYDLDLWPVRDVGTGLAVLLGAAIVASRPIFAGTPLREFLAPVGLGFMLYGLGGMGRFWRGWADEGWILVVGVSVGVLALGVVGWTLARVRAPAHGWVVGLLATGLLVALGTSMPALPVALCFLVLGLLSRDLVVIVAGILAVVGYGAWAYTAFDWPVALKALALLGSGGVLIGLRAYLRRAVPEGLPEGLPETPTRPAEAT